MAGESIILPAAICIEADELLTEISTKNLPWGGGGNKERPAHKADKPIVQKMRKLRRLTTLWASMTCYKDKLTEFAMIIFPTVMK
jgi:hypothetical protein